MRLRQPNGASPAAGQPRTCSREISREGRIDADSGKIVDAGETIPEIGFDPEDRIELAGLATASTTIARAVRIAEQHA
jgi:hypothetical protein